MSNDCEQRLELAVGRHSWCFLGRLSGQETRTVALERPSWRHSKGVADDAVILILGNIYGLNGAPQRWWKKFDAVMSSIGFSRSTFDVCVNSLRSTAGNLEGILCVHVDDTICGGSGSLFSEALSNLRHRFPFRKWQVEEGMFCGSKYVQNKDNKDIMITQTEFAVKITKVPVSPARKKCETILLTKLKFMRFVVSVAVSVGWLVKHFRTCLVKCHNCSKLCLNQLSLRSVVRVWWCVVFTSMLIWVSRSDEYFCEPINYQTGKYFPNKISHQLHYSICRFRINKNIPPVTLQYSPFSNK